MANVPDAALGFFLDNLKEFITYNATLIGGVKDTVHQLTKDLDQLKAFIKKCTEKNQDNDEFLQSLVNAVRDVVHQAENAIETYIVYASRQKLRGAFDKTFHAVDHLFELRKVGKELKNVSANVQKLYQNQVPIAVEAWRDVRPANPSGKKRRMFASEDDNIVGFEDAAEEVINLLTGESEQLEVFTIVGMLGLGKTTLARKVFKDPTTEYKFFARAFVNVSEEYDKKEVFLKILGHFIPINQEIIGMSVDTIKNKIHEQLKEKQYLIVLDDVWTPDAWDELKVAFPTNNKHSRVLITTRNSPVGLHANAKVEPYKLRFLYNRESHELLRRKVFGDNNFRKEFKNYEDLIVEKCKGLPLAIVVVAGILLNRRERIDWWKKVADEDVKNYNPANQEHSTYLINLSFSQLPYYLKPCFLYLGVFREDFDIPVWKLLRLWLAEGFVQGEGNLEDIAEQYLEDLVDRSLVMVGQNRLTGQIKTCRVHDLLREFCKNQAIKENLFQEFKGLSVTANPNLPLDDCYRICINSQGLDYCTSMSSVKRERARSFLSFAKEEITLPSEHISSIPKAFKLLRVLDVKSIRFTSFPSELYYLVLLKYIAMSCDFKILAAKLSYLWNLQTLIIETSSRTLEIKADIWKMGRLRHVHTNTSTLLLKGKEEPSASAKSGLQTLSTISPESCTREVFERTPMLKKLGIRGKLAPVVEPKSGPGLFDHLSRLESLENLKLLNDDVTAKLYCLPDAKKFPSKLTRLTLLNTFLDWKYMSTLGKLENLEVLKLKENAFVGDFWDTEDGGFPCLKVLHIGSTDLLGWKASASHFPILTTLILKYCSRLNGIPRDLADIESFQRIDLHWSPSAVSSAKNIQVVKLQVQKQKNKPGGFKVTVYPPE